jgi:hypothetical protein
LPKAVAVVAAAAEEEEEEEVEVEVVVPVEALARAVLPEQAAAVRVLLPIRRPILQARPGAALILRSWAIRTPVRTPTPITRTARTKAIKIAHPVAAETPSIGTANAATITPDVVATMCPA